MKRLVIASVLMASCTVACAEEGFFATPKANVFDYNYLEGSFVTTEKQGNGFGVNGSVDVANNWAVIAGINYTSTDNVDYSDFRVGAEYHQQIVPDKVPGLDVLVRAQIQNFYTGTDNNDSNDLGLRVGGGVRYLVMPKLEVFGDADLATAGDSTLTLSGGVRYTFIKHLLGFGKVDFSNNNSLSVGLRYQF